MPKWKKMAAAFGRAVSDPSATKKGRNLVLESKTVKEAPGDYRVTAQDTPEQRSYKGGRYQGDEAWELTHDEREIPEEAKRIYENYDFDYERAYGPDDAYKRAVELSGVDDGNWPIPRTIEDFKEMYGFDIGGNMPKHKPGYRKALEREASGYSDMNLEKEFNDEFDKLTKQNVRENPQNNSFTEDEVRKESINMLKSGADISDVFEYLRGNSDHIKVNPTKLKEHTTIRTSPKSSEDADVGVVWDYLADRIDNPEKLDYIMDYHDEFIRQQLRNGTSPEDIARTLDTDIFD